MHFLMNPDKQHGLTYVPDVGEEVVDIFLGAQLRLGKTTLQVHFESPQYLGVEPEEPFTVT
jgi:hypothetical protein